jgi:tetratricopeptide (TPR) repeat protein
VDVRPNYQDVAAKLGEAQYQRKLAALYDQAIAAQGDKKWQEAVAAFEELMAEAANFKDVATRLETVRKQKQLTELYSEAHRLHQAQKWQAVINVFAKIAAIDPKYADPESLLSTAEQKLAAQKRQVELDNLYSRAVREMDASHWREAHRLLVQLQRMHPGFRDVERLLARAEVDIAGEKTTKRPLRKSLKWVVLVTSILALIMGAVAVWFLLTPAYDPSLGDVFWADDHLLWGGDSILVSAPVSASEPPYLVAEVKGSRIQVIGQDARGQLLVGLEGDGLDHQQGDQWKRYVFEGGVSANTVQAIASDQRNGTWIGMRDGVAFLDDNEWSFYTTADGLSGDDIRAISVSADGTVWLGTWGDGLIAWRKDQPATYTLGDNVQWNRVAALHALGEDLWIGTQAGLVQFGPLDTQQRYTRADGLPANFATALASDPDGRLWVGTWGGGVGVIDGTTIVSHVFTSRKLNCVVDLAVGGDKVWVLSPAGIMVFDLETEMWATYYKK